MENETIVAIIGLISTTLVSSIGLYYTAKSKNIFLREALFEKQLDLMTRMISLLGEFKNLGVMIISKESSYVSFASKKLDEKIPEFALLEAETAAIFPLELFSLTRDLSQSIHQLRNKRDKNAFNNHLALSAQFALLCREVIGVETLTIQNIKLFSTQKSYERIYNIPLQSFKKIIIGTNKKKRK